MPLMLVLGLLLAYQQVKATQGLNFAKIALFVQQQFGDQAFRRTLAWQALIEQNREQPVEAQLEAVNDFFNQLQFSDDIKIWQQEDYWATPVEFIGRGAGDCEDFTIAKYYTLVALGVPSEKLRLMYVKAVRFNQHHMVLTYYQRRGSEPLVLDNIDPKIKKARFRKDLLPIYSFNAEYLWLTKSRGIGKLVGSSDRLSLWKELRQRQQEFSQ
ncbi:transglutaminase-like cysteine peptidase [Marinobacterium sp. CAU 1594]|nr:transglutaminase-like cysteine peptidase [Marinobacterium arenosum]